ncbi:hypothetical protein [Enteractinococcus helveticum]|uniref:Uncharacterized protein n=1 Tax=Enteractinococcus helveticum TaxID=1837282 RepID=A0A1B7M3G5_9MICC|nr:hypothetical protein [Enteractinococcus helveticum]OAV63122.1 hypothetical protein A6F49_02925 [Enteractinococcus helveticum]
MKIYRKHYCLKQHKTARTFLKCAIPRNAWISGTGNIAVIAWCRVPTITLWGNEVDAYRAKKMIDDSACGGNCNRRHDIVKVEIS